MNKHCENCGKEIAEHGFCSDECEQAFYEWYHETKIVAPNMIDCYCDDCGKAVVANGNSVLVLCGECNGSGKTIGYTA